MNEKELITYYNKFNEDKRLTTKHGNVEFLTAIKYISEYLNDYDNPKIIDIGAGTGIYSNYFEKLGYDVTAVELVKHNLKVIEKKNSNIKAYQGNALKLKKFKDNSFEITILFGPMYHLLSMNEKIQALNEAKRITKDNGLIFISYYMNEYAIINYGFIEGNINNSIKNNLVDKSFHIIHDKDNLYSMVRLEDIDYLKDVCSLTRVKILAQDGPTEYLKKTINNMDNETYETYLQYHFKICERYELLGASRHILDILKKDKTNK